MSDAEPIVATFSDFQDVLSEANYVALPDDGWIGMTDVVGSTEQIAAGRSKAVNMAGAAAISAVMNALGRCPFDFAFGGDGAVIAVSADNVERVRRALSQTVTWCREELDLELRAALVSIREIRTNGLDVRVANYAPSAAVRYAMFSGGGVRWADAQMKAGAFRVAAAAAGARPDLTGLSCRWQPIKPDDGVVLSLIVQAGAASTPATFNDVIGQILGRFSAAQRAGHPISARGPKFGSPLQGFDLELKAAAVSGGRMAGALRLLQTLKRS